MKRILFIIGLGLTTGPALAQLSPVGAPSNGIARPMSSQQIDELVGDLVKILRETFVFPDVAERYAEVISAKHAAGDYRKFTDRAELARVLTADLQAVAPDGHLRVTPTFSGPPTMRRPGGRGLPPVAAAQWIAPGIAYVEFNVFPQDSESVAAAAKFMEDYLDAKTIIFDVRRHRGGTLLMMDSIFPYLFSEPTRLLAIDIRQSVAAANGGPPQLPTLRRANGPPTVLRTEHWAVPHPTEHRLKQAQIFVLTSNRTASAAEHFVAAFKATKRGTVIGEATRGLGNGGMEQQLPGGFGAFVPFGRTFDPATGEGWEATGVAPTIAVPAERALIEALTRTGMSEAAATAAARLTEATLPQQSSPASSQTGSSAPVHLHR